MSISTSNTIKLLRALSGQENTYTIPKLYVRLTECHVRALILNQLVFFSDKSTRHDNDWFDKTYEDWEKETYVKERTLRNIFTQFKKRNWCESKTIKVNGKRTLMCRPRLENILKDLYTMLEKDPETHKVKNSPNRQNLPNSQPANFAVSNTIYTDKTSDKTTTETKPVVVVKNNLETLSPHETQKLTESFEKTPFETVNIKTLTDFMSAALFSIMNRGDTITRQQRLHGIIKLVKQGQFDEPIGWAKNIEKKQIENKTPTQEDFDNYKNCKAGFEWVGLFLQKQRQDKEKFKDELDANKTTMPEKAL